MKKIINYKPFLVFLIIISILAIIFLFRPFLVEIIISAVLVSVFYSLYEKLSKILWGKKYLASFIMCLLLLLLIIIPLLNLLIYSGKRASIAYNSVNEIIEKADIIQYSFLDKINIGQSGEEMLKNLIIESTRNIKNWIVGSAAFIVKGTTNFAFSLVLILLSMFFFFVEGKSMAQKLVIWSPLPNKYDLEIIKRFRLVSKTTLISIFVTALFQGIFGALGFLMIGWPFIFIFVIMAFLSLIPYIGSSIFYIPASIYLMSSGQFWQGLFVLLWCWLVVSNVDEIIRAYIIKGKSQVNPIFIIFSIMGGITFFGFWGVVIGPLIIALATTIFYIYELEYSSKLD